MTISMDNPVSSLPHRRGWFVLVAFLLGAPAAVAQDITGLVNIDQSNSDAAQATSNVTVEDFRGRYIKGSTVGNGNLAKVGIVDGVATITQNQSGTVDASSTLTAGKVYLVKDTSISAGNNIAFDSRSGFFGFIVNIEQENTSASGAEIVLDAGEIEFYRTIVSTTGNDALTTSANLHSAINLRQNNTDENSGELRQSGSSAAASTNIGVAGNRKNYTSTQPVVAWHAAYR